MFTRNTIFKIIIIIFKKRLLQKHREIVAGHIIMTHVCLHYCDGYILIFIRILPASLSRESFARLELCDLFYVFRGWMYEEKDKLVPRVISKNSPGTACFRWKFLFWWRICIYDAYYDGYLLWCIIDLHTWFDWLILDLIRQLQNNRN